MWQRQTSARFRGFRYELFGSLDFSQVAGRAHAIAAHAARCDALLSAARRRRGNPPRHDAHVPLPATRGDPIRRWRQPLLSRRTWSVAPRVRDQTTSLFAACEQVGGAPGRVSSTGTRVASTSAFQWNFNWWQYWTSAGLPESGRSIPIPTPHPQHLVVPPSADCRPAGNDVLLLLRARRPAVRQDSYLAPWAGVAGDDRRRSCRTSGSTIGGGRRAVA